MNNEDDRRRFHRFPFEADCEILLDAGPPQPCELLDLSINGALVAVPDARSFESSREGDLALKIRGLVNGQRTEMVLSVSAVRVEQDRIACRLVHVEPRSFEHLKSLVADNLGDLTMLDRELTQLDYWPGLSQPVGERRTAAH